MTSDVNVVVVTHRKEYVLEYRPESTPTPTEVWEVDSGRFTFHKHKKNHHLKIGLGKEATAMEEIKHCNDPVT